jgi:CPA1 family monovalent cation:H+ antiporter
MTFGSILSATDPVAVSALLNAVGAPPRLMIHISAEKLLNDGSAMVFYTIFR